MNILFLFLFFLLACTQQSKINTPAPLPVETPEILSVDYGLTLDSVDQNLPAIITALKAMPRRPYVRLVFDYPRPAKDFIKAVDAISQIATIIGQPSDSEYNSKMTVDQYHQRFLDYVSNLPKIDIWEICNECNGDWLGSNAIKQAEKALAVTIAYKKRSLYTAYWNTPNCADKHGEWFAWSKKNLTKFLKENVTHASLSVYGYDCDGPEPTYQVLDTNLKNLQLLFPASIVMIGEFGKQGSESVMKHYLKYPKKGWGIYWFGRQDLVPMTNPLFKVFTGEK